MIVSEYLASFIFDLFGVQLSHRGIGPENRSSDELLQQGGSDSGEKSSMSNSKPYSGILAEPMPKVMALTGPADDEIRALIDAKMRALFVHHDIDPADAFEVGPKMASAWANLAWCLAREHVPGFRGPQRMRGKPAARKADDVILVMHVELLKRRDKLSERGAIHMITAQNLISGTEPTLLQRYKRAKKQFSPISILFDNISDREGRGVFVRAMEEALSGDEKESFLSPDRVCA